MGLQFRQYSITTGTTTEIFIELHFGGGVYGAPFFEVVGRRKSRMSGPA